MAVPTDEMLAHAAVQAALRVVRAAAAAEERAKLQPAIDRVAHLAEAAQAKAVEMAVAAERERIIALADRVDASYDAPCPSGVPDCVHQDTPFADLLRGGQAAPGTTGETHG